MHERPRDPERILPDHTASGDADTGGGQEIRRPSRDLQHEMDGMASGTPRDAARPDICGEADQERRTAAVRVHERGSRVQPVSAAEHVDDLHGRMAVLVPGTERNHGLRMAER